jgi:hypothetical protein
MEFCGFMKEGKVARITTVFFVGRKSFDVCNLKLNNEIESEFYEKKLKLFLQ